MAGEAEGPFQLGAATRAFIGSIALFLMACGNTVSDSHRERQDWEEYRNERFDFEIRYPADWSVYEDLELEIRPIVSLYPTSSRPDLPITQHERAGYSYISIFPLGGASEGVIGQTRRVELKLAVSLNPESKTYLLNDGSVWGWYMKPAEPPDSWNRYGFVWSQTGVSDFELECFSGGQRVSQHECEPLMGDRLVRHGNVDRADRKLQKEVLSSFRFID